MKKLKLFILGFIITLLLVISLSPVAHSRTAPEILWDTWGVPHIYSSSPTGLSYGLGWAQARNHGDRLLTLYAQARGQAAELGGILYQESDRFTHTMGIPDRARQWYDDQTPDMQGHLDAFAQGINDYVDQHPETIDATWQAVLPLTGIDVLAHIQRVLHFHFLTNPIAIEQLQTQIRQPAGSNAWVIGPQKSESGNALLVANPHLPWSNPFWWFEAHLVADNLNAYGGTLVGMPFLAIAFNDYLGWALTVNPLDGADIYELPLVTGGYEWQGQTQPFTERVVSLKIKQPEGNLRTEQFVQQDTVIGPVLGIRDNHAYVLRVIGLDRPGIPQQFWDMVRSKNLTEFKSALAQQQLPLFNVLYGDKTGDIYYVFNGLIPERTGTWADWQGVISSSRPDWGDYLSFSALPQLTNPETGWLQNTNDPPWTSTWPSQLNPADYPATLAPPDLSGTPNNILRAQRSLKALIAQDAWTLEQLIDLKMSSEIEMAERILDKLVPTARALANPIGIEAAEVLAQWDRQATPDSKGAVLFYLWALSMKAQGIFSRPWTAAEPLDTPNGLRDINLALAVLEGTAAQVQLLYDDLAVSWGDVVRLKTGEQAVPASGAPGNLGSLRVMDIASDQDEKFQAIAGDTFILAVEFSDPPQAKSLMVYGNASQPGSPHIGDQLESYVKNEFRPVLRSQTEILKNLELREQLSFTEE